jgi:hypothetical protein
MANLDFLVRQEMGLLKSLYANSVKVLAHGLGGWRSST